MNEPNIRIINKTGRSNDTEIYVGETRVQGVIKLEIKPITAIGEVEVTITGFASELNIEAFAGELIHPTFFRKEDSKIAMSCLTDLNNEYRDIVDNYGEALIKEICRRAEHNETLITICLDGLRSRLIRQGRYQKETLEAYLNSVFDK